MFKYLGVALCAAFLIGCLDNKPAATAINGKDKSSTEKGVAKKNQFWWPKLIDLSPLRQHSEKSNPYDNNYDYKSEFLTLNLDSVKQDLKKLMKDSQEWWPADYGHYGPFFIRLAWHSAGTYRVADGRGGAGGGQMRFEPLNSWPDNGNLDKARRLLWPIKKKYGKKLSWADLMILSGNVALEDMGFKTFGFAGGRTDDWEPDLVYWGPENEFLKSHRRSKDGKLNKKMGATQMGLIYVNPEGPGGKPDFQAAANAIREAFARMAMNDEETVALIAGGHSFGKAHGAKKVEDCVGSAPAGSKTEEQGLGWKNKCGTGSGKDATTSGLEGAWTSTPTKWSMQYLQFLYSFEWKISKSPNGAIQWVPKSDDTKNLVPDAHDSTKRHKPIMFTTDLALRYDEKYGKITKRFLENPKEFEDAFARAWFKLTHRDMGPRSRYVGNNLPSEILKWQDPVKNHTGPTINPADINSLKSTILKSGLSVEELVRVAWASAATYRGTDRRGGANGARIRLEPQVSWEVNNPQELKKVLGKLEEIKNNFNTNSSRKISTADIIVLGGNAAIEQAAKAAGQTIKVPFKPGRTDASQENTDVTSFSHLELKADGFRNYYSKDSEFSPVISLIDRANLLQLSVPEMTVLIGGLRALNANANSSANGVLTKRPGVLSNDFFVNLFDMSVKWEKASSGEVYEAKNRKTGAVIWTATPVDLAFGSSSELRTVGEVYAADDGENKFVNDFVKAWSKVMNLDRSH